jgi:hypothetical protein
MRSALVASHRLASERVAASPALMSDLKQLLGSMSVAFGNGGR